MQRYRSTAVFSAYTGENIDCLQLSLCLSQFMVSVWRVLILFLKGQMTLNTEAGWRMRASRKHWRKWAPVMTDGSHVTDFRCKSSSMKQQKHSLQPVNAASEWKKKKNQTGSWATRAGEVSKDTKTFVPLKAHQTSHMGLWEVLTRTFTGWNCSINNCFGCSANAIMLVLLHSDTKKISQSSNQQKEGGGGGNQGKFLKQVERTHSL